MTDALLATKLRIPRVRAELIARPRLLERLDAGLTRPLTLVSAPAGFGKTTLLAGWITRLDRPGAWLNLEERDSDSVRFLTYYIGALLQVESEAGSSTLASLRSPGMVVHLSSVLPAPLNDIQAMPAIAGNAAILWPACRTVSRILRAVSALPAAAHSDADRLFVAPGQLEL